jgi:F420-non-reducing hydrogenase small subunit
MKTSIAVEWLSGCGGCDLAIVDLRERLIDLARKTTFVHWPMLADIKGIPAADIGIITGGIRSEHDRETAGKMREACGLLIAFGTCAVYGGIGGAANVHRQEEMLQAVYREELTMVSGELPGTGDTLGAGDLPRLEDRVLPLGSVVKVDASMPGCPPHPDYISESLTSLIQGGRPPVNRKTVCSKCTRNMVRTDTARLKRWADGIPRPEICFLSQGYLCFGCVTVERCQSPCPNKGVICTGCGGPSFNVIVEPNREMRTGMASLISSMTRIRYEAIVTHIEERSKTFYAHVMSSPVINSKPGFDIKGWIDRTGGPP